jgi:hypothetical protein
MAAVVPGALLTHALGARGRLRSRGRREGRNTRLMPVTEVAIRASHEVARTRRDRFVQAWRA